MSIQDKIAKGEEWKAKGNAFVKEKKYKKAIVQYSTVFAYINGLSGSGGGGDNGGFVEQAQSALGGGQQATPEEEAQVKDLTIAVNNNLALCHLKNGNNEKAAEHASKVLALDEGSAKAYLRLGQAYLADGIMDKAKTSLMKAYKLEPTNASVKQELAAFKVRVKALKEKQKQDFSGIFKNAKAGSAPSLSALSGAAEGEDSSSVVAAGTETATETDASNDSTVTGAETK